MPPLPSNPGKHWQSSRKSFPPGATDCAWQLRHTVAPVLLENVLSAHVPHAPLPTPALAVPPTHAAQVTKSTETDGKYAPALHTLLLPKTTCELSAGQFRHSVELAD